MGHHDRAHGPWVIMGRHDRAHGPWVIMVRHNRAHGPYRHGHGPNHDHVRSWSNRGHGPSAMVIWSIPLIMVCTAKTENSVITVTPPRSGAWSRRRDRDEGPYRHTGPRRDAGPYHHAAPHRQIQCFQVYTLRGLRGSLPSGPLNRSRRLPSVHVQALTVIQALTVSPCAGSHGDKGAYRQPMCRPLQALTDSPCAGPHRDTGTYRHDSLT